MGIRWGVSLWGACLRLKRGLRGACVPTARPVGALVDPQDPSRRSASRAKCDEGNQDAPDRRRMGLRRGLVLSVGRARFKKRPLAPITGVNRGDTGRPAGRLPHQPTLFRATDQQRPMSSFSQINTNIQSQQAFQNLADTSEELSNRRQRLSTGLRINSASDDAAGFEIANRLEAKTGAQQQALRNIGDAKSALSTAEGALDSQLDILQTAKEKATQAANGSLSQNERNSIAGELKQLTSELGDIQEDATFNGDKLLGGNSFVFQTGASSTSTFEVETPDASLGGDNSVLGLSENFDLTTQGKDAVSFDQGDFTGKDPTIKDDLSVASGNVTVATDSDNNLAGELNGGRFNVEVTNDSASGNLTFSVEGKEGEQTVDVSGSGNDITLETDGSNSITFEASNSFSDSDVEANESKEFSVTVRDQKDIGKRLDGGTANNAKAIIDDVDTALNNVTSELSNLGASQNRLSFKESNLETTRTNLNAAQSRIEDADFAKEQTQVAKLQVQQQSGTAQLAQANAAGQSVLSLLQ